MRRLLLCLAVLAAPAGSFAQDRIAAFVGRKAVLESEIREKMRAEKSPREQALKGLIGEKMILIEAERSGIAVSDADVRKEEAAFRRRFPDETAFLQSLEREGLTIQEFRRRMRERVLMKRIVSERVYRRASVSMPELMRESEAVRRDLGTEYRLFGKDFTDKEAAEAFARDWKAGRLDEMEDLGTMTRVELLPQIAAAVADLPEGVASAPVFITRWHIFAVKERKTVAVPEEKVRETARTRVLQRAYDAGFAEFLAELEKKTPVTIVHE